VFRLAKIKQNKIKHEKSNAFQQLVNKLRSKQTLTRLGNLEAQGFPKRPQDIWKKPIPKPNSQPKNPKNTQTQNNRQHPKTQPTWELNCQTLTTKHLQKNNYFISSFYNLYVRVQQPLMLTSTTQQLLRPKHKGKQKTKPKHKSLRITSIAGFNTTIEKKKVIRLEIDVM
jgi:hypothetical protein